MYRCGILGCDFDLYVWCVKYVRRIFYFIYDEYEFVFVNELIVGLNSYVWCDGCDNFVDFKEFVYYCEECGFDFYLNCVIGDVVCS